jgi:hypothetical protein
MSKKEEVKEPIVTDTTPLKQEGEFKIKSAKKIKQLGEDKVPEIIKVDLSKNKKEEN